MKIEFIYVHLRTICTVMALTCFMGNMNGQEAVGSVAGSFDVSATGAAVYSIPVEVPAGVGGLQPSLSITYSSQSGNGMAGWGCNLSGISAITRAPKDIYHDGTAKGLSYQADDAFYLDGQRLIYSSGTAGQEGALYHPESDPFTKVTVHGTYNSTTANTWYEVQASSGMKYHYGSTASGRLSYTSGSSPRIHAWYLDYVEDPLGNYMEYTYISYSSCMYPSTITYGNNKTSPNSLRNTVSFSYEYRSDVMPFILEGVKGSMSQRLKTITSRTGNTTFRSYELQYDNTSDGSGTKFSRLTAVTEKNGSGEALKPTRLQWSYLPPFFQSVSQPPVSAASVFPSVAFSEQQFIAGDLNGDGLTDIVGFAPVKVPQGINTSVDKTYAYIYWASLDASGNIQYKTGTNYELPPYFQMQDWLNQRGASSILDFDGDGINDILVPNLSVVKVISSQSAGFSIISQGLINGKTIPYQLKYSREMPEYATGDFNNDGKADIVCMEKSGKNGKYPCSIMGFNATASPYSIPFDLSLPSKPEKIFSGDFNGNGLTDILVFYNKGYTIFWNQGGSISNAIFSDSKKTPGVNIGDVYKISTGDFNGDGLLDFLMNETDDNKWYFALNNGDGTFTKQHACTLEAYKHSYTKQDQDKFQCLVYDMDMDGKSDVVIIKAMYRKKSNKVLGIGNTWGEFEKTHAYWMRSNGTSLTQVASATSNRDEDALSYRYLPGDFTGNGQTELMNFGYNCYSSNNANSNPVWRLYRNSSFNAGRGKVEAITDGYGNTTSITYASPVNSDIYTKEQGSVYPVADYPFPVHAVKEVRTNNGAAGGMVTTGYRYRGFKVHLQGKGMMGLTSVTASNTTLGTTVESGVKSWDTNFYIPSETYTKTTVDGKTAETAVKMTITDKGSRKYFIWPSTKTEKDLDGNTLTTTCKFDTSNGYITEEKADFGNNMYKTTQYENYILAGNAYKPQQITSVQKHTDDNSTFTQKTKITYNTGKGYQEQVIKNYGSSLPLTTDYRYDAYGNVIQEKVSGSGVPELATGYDYDATRRFVEKTYTTPASSVSRFSCDTWGNVLTEKDETNASDILTTTHTYDNWGFRTSTTLPDPNAGTSTFVYDAAGRTVRQTDARNKATVNEYDELGRIRTSTTDGVKTGYTYGTSGYDLLRLVKMVTGVNTISNSTVYSYDRYGRVKTEKCQVGFKYEYNTNGQLSEITYPGGLQVTRQYDGYGNLEKVTADGQTVWELTGETGTVTTVQLGGALTATTSRNTQGLLTNRKTVRGATVLHNMDYVFNGATGNLTSRSGMAGQSESFQYDNVDRLTSVQQGSSTVMSIGYHPNGNLDTKTGVGKYSYGNQPHAVGSVENTEGLISGNQNITYNGFNKVSSISENGYTLEFTYGPDRQRRKSVLKQNNNPIKTTLFVGDYEQITENGSTLRICYIADGVIHVKQQGQTDKIYYACTDHLGSVMKLVDADGTTVFGASYDAWGRQTVTTNTFRYNRGYTGHEHLSEFGLINMNGRMYGPVLGRFLSPDPFVQEPEFSQSFNRYSYCFNNPLRYTDPSGENPFLIVALVGFGTGYLSHGITTGNWGMNAVYSGLFTSAGFTLGYIGAGFNTGNLLSALSHFSTQGAWKYAGMGAINTALSHVMPSFSTPEIGGFSISISPMAMLTSGIASSAGGGFSLGAGIGVHQRIGNWTLSAGLNAHGGDVSSVYGGFLYDNGKRGFSYYHNWYMQGNKQQTGIIGGRSGDWSFRWENDVKYLLGDGHDRLRSNATEIGYKNFVLGTNVYTTDPGGYTDEYKDYENNGSRIFNNKFGTYKEGFQLSSPLYVGMRGKNGITRIGFNNPAFGDFFQNGFHHLKLPFIVWGVDAIRSGNFQLGNYSNSYYQSGRYMPYSLY